MSIDDDDDNESQDEGGSAHGGQSAGCGLRAAWHGRAGVGELAWARSSANGSCRLASARAAARVIGATANAPVGITIAIVVAKQVRALCLWACGDLERLVDALQ